jgi:hypothetical protein
MDIGKKSIFGKIWIVFAFPFKEYHQSLNLDNED